MRRALLAAVLCTLAAARASAQSVSGQALLAFQRYDNGPSFKTSGFRQTYDLRLTKAFTPTSIVRLFFRGDDFQADNSDPGTAATRTRQLNPSGEILLRGDTISLQARSDYYDTVSHFGNVESGRTLQRSRGTLVWSPVNLPSFTVAAQRNATHDDQSRFDLRDTNLLGIATWNWRSLQLSASENRTRTDDSFREFRRTTAEHRGEMLYTLAALHGKLTGSVTGAAQFTDINESGGRAQSTLVPIPVPVSRALWSVDDTPSDDRDHPLISTPALIDKNESSSAGIALGPSDPSFHNIALDLGHVERLDEIWIVVRDAQGNPLRNGGGTVTWDVYTSEDGGVWTPIGGTTAFSAPLSAYVVTFGQTYSRWFKVVSFGVNVEPANVTEIVAYYHTRLAAGQALDRTQKLYDASATFGYTPTKRWSFGYTGLWNNTTQTSQLEDLATTYLDQVADIRYVIKGPFAIRTHLGQRTSRVRGLRSDEQDEAGLLFEYIPTRELRVISEVSRQRQTIAGTEFNLDTRAIRASAWVIKSVYVSLDLGQQTQTFTNELGNSERTYATFSTNMQLLPTLRMLLNGSLQRVTTTSTDPAVQLLGAERDNRIASEFLWRPGRPLSITARFGYASGVAFSGFTQRYHVEWYPFEGGTVSLGGTYDEDLDPALDRRTRRVMFNPRWSMNRWATFDINYTSVSATALNASRRQQTFFATLTLTR